MNRGRCVYCIKRISGEVESITLTLCCVHCATGGKGHRRDKLCTEYYSVTEEHAVEFLGCDQRELNCLNYTLRQPHGISDDAPRLYLQAEVKFLVELRKAWELESRSGIRLKDIDPVIRHFLLGDYLHCDPEADVIETVLKRCKVLDQVTEIVQHCKAHPADAFAFCLENLTAGAKEFQELKDKMKLVFRLERPRIMTHLSVSEQEELLHTVLKSEYVEFRDRDWPVCVRNNLLEQVSLKTADEIMKFSGCQHSLQRGGDASMVASNLLDYWNRRKDAELRREQMKAEFVSTRH